MSRRFSWLIATGCGIGCVPQAPGTIASIVTLLLWWWLWPALKVQVIVTLVIIPIGWWAASDLARRQHDRDPQIVVIDEIAGMWLALIGLPKHFLLVLLTLVLFRILDIFKLPPIRQLERLPGGLGIMLDDVVAGLFARGILAIVMNISS